jgi:UDP-N-acetyl-D-mannosaminuronate dehydrogenase
LGLSYKPNVADTRESPSYIIIEKLKNLGAKIDIYDPLVKNESTVSNLDELLKKSEFLVLLTGHRSFYTLNNIDVLSQNNIKALIDGRNFLDINKFKNSKIIYNGIGR